MQPLTANHQIALPSFLDNPVANTTHVGTKQQDPLKPEYRPHRTILR